MRSALAQVSGKKELIGRTDLDVAIGNECGRLVANTIIAYNSMLLSGLLNRYQAADDRKALELLKRISPVVASSAITLSETASTPSISKPSSRG